MIFRALGLCLVFSSFVIAQTNLPLPVPDVSTIVAEAVTAFSPMPVQQIELSGTAKAYAGSLQPTGRFTATLKATGESTLQLSLDKLSRTETTGPFGDLPVCGWTGADGITHEAAQHNCFLGVNWLLPMHGAQAHSAALQW